MPPDAAGIAWIFHNASGIVTAVCTPSASSGAAAETCAPTKALGISGHVRFATGATATLEDAAQPASPALDLDLKLTLQQGEAVCFDNSASATTPGDLRYHCLVTLAAGQNGWSGRLDIVPRGWALAPRGRAVPARCKRRVAPIGRAGGPSYKKHFQLWPGAWWFSAAQW